MLYIGKTKYWAWEHQTEVQRGEGGGGIQGVSQRTTKANKTKSLYIMYIYIYMNIMFYIYIYIYMASVSLIHDSKRSTVPPEVALVDLSRAIHTSP